MTSNQIAAASLREEKRHNAETEALNKRAQREQERQNKRETMLKAAQNINTAANNIANAYGMAYSNDTQAAQQASQQAGQVAESRYKATMGEVSTRQQREQERYNKVQSELTLRNIQHLEYQDQLQALRDDWQRNVDNFNASYHNAEIAVKSAANTINSYLAEIERANLNINSYKVYSEAMLNEYTMALREAQTDEARAKIVTNYINASTTLLNSILGALKMVH